MRRALLSTLLLTAILLGFFINLVLAFRFAAPDSPPAPADGHGQLMANINLEDLRADEAAQLVQWAAEDGMAFVRLRAAWNEIQPEPNIWRWETADAAIDAAQRAGLGVVLLLDAAPAWAVADVDRANPLAPPRDVRDFGRFAEKAAARYAGRVYAYQIWNEPNIAPHWGARNVRPQGYFELLREAGNSIHRADPDARIMLASLAPTIADDGANMPDLRFLEQLYQLNAAEQFDLAAAAAYGFEQTPEAPPAADQLNFRRPELFHEVMARYGDRDKPLWITAWGWWTPTAHFAAEDSPWGAVDPALLPAYQTRGLELAREQWPWAGPLAWVAYALSPADDPRRGGFVQRDPNGDLTSAGHTLSELAREPIPIATGSHTLADLGVRPDDWRIAPRAADPNAASATIEIPFRGRAAALEIQRGLYWATLRVWIDDQPAPLLPRDEAGAAYISLHDPDNRVETVVLARDLNPGLHRLRLEATAGWGQWFLRRIIIDHRVWPKPWPFWPVTTALAIALLFVGWSWLRAWRSPQGRALLARGLEIWDQITARVRATRPALHFPLGLLLVAAFYLVPGLPLSFIFFLPVALFLALRLDLAAAMALAALSIYLRPKPLGPIGLPLHEILIWTAFGLWLLRVALSRVLSPKSKVQGPKSRDNTQHPILNPDLPLFLILIIAFFAMLAAERKGVAVYEFRTIFLTPGLFYLLITRMERDRPINLTALADGAVLGALLLSLIAIWQFLNGQAEFVEGVPRVKALFGSPNNLALYLGRVIPLLFAVGLTPLFWKWGRKGRSKSTGSAETAMARPDFRSWLYLLLLAPILLAAVLTFSKGLLLLSLPMGFIALAFFEPRLRRPVFALFLLGLFALIPLFRTERFADLFDTSGGTTFLRLQLWRSAWRMFLDHPWLGVGPDNFLYAYRSQYVLPAAWEELNLSHPHNFFLDALTRLGILGLVPILWVLGLTLFRGHQLLRSHTPSPSRPLADSPLPPLASSPSRLTLLGLYAGLIGGLAHGLIDNSLFLIDLSILTLLVVGVIARAARSAHPPAE
ncbi:MAG: hypothetical protein GXP42_06680 [Chloroflexi bacterium]|nr:hypothetical protein [Chloroflexota bacterium]